MPNQENPSTVKTVMSLLAHSAGLLLLVASVIPTFSCQDAADATSGAVEAIDEFSSHVTGARGLEVKQDIQLQLNGIQNARKKQMDEIHGEQ